MRMLWSWWMLTQRSKFFKNKSKNKISKSREEKRRLHPSWRPGRNFIPLKNPEALWEMRPWDAPKWWKDQHPELVRDRPGC